MTALIDGVCTRDSVSCIEPSTDQTPSELWGTLTPREQEVASLIAVGMSRSIVAIRLGCTARTIDSHRTSILNKLGIENNVALARWTLRHGYVTLEDVGR